MNKKFYTLVASILLASSVGGYAQTPTANAGALASALTLNVTGNAFGVEAVKGVSQQGTGYQVGVAYALGESVTSLLYVEGTKTLAYGDPTSLTSGDLMEKSDRALWVLTQIIPGDKNNNNLPKYVFVNKFTKTVLSFDPAQADKGISDLGGSQTEWLSAPSYKEPQTEANIYAAVGEDKVVALAYKIGETKVSLVKIDAGATLVAPTGYTLVSVKPHKISSQYVLSANDLNTMLGKAGEKATKDSYFTFNFAPEATMNAELNKFAVDLQAVAVKQMELQHGVAATDGGSGKAYASGSNENGYKVNGYSSLYPAPIENKDKFADLTAADNLGGYANTQAQWVALRNREGKYLVVDTAYVKGTGQAQNKRITFAWDDLYNLKNDTRYRDPRSYLFKVKYDLSTQAVKIFTYGYVLNPQPKGHAGVDLVKVYEGNGSEQPIKEGSKWYADNTTVVDHNSNADDQGNQIVKAALVNLNEVTLGVEATDNKFAIKLGHSDAYVPTHVASGAYLIKVVSSTNPDRVGKYWVNNLKGGFEIMEQANRQNFQHMPAAQWIVTSAGTTDGSPVTIVNREFMGEPDAISKGTLYKADNGVFFAGGDVLEFIAVENAADKYLGYKYVAKDTINQSIFTFNYLHELSMDKPINTTNPKDSVVWVDNNGDAMEFVLVEALGDDSYGTNGNLANVANLVRKPYYIKVNDATLVEDDQRYLTYNTSLKKYIVKKGKKNAQSFLLKENNEVEGGSCYYTLVLPNIVPVVALENPNNDLFDTSNGQFKTNDRKVVSSATLIADNDIAGMFLAKDGKVKDPETGLDVDAKVVAEYDSQNKAREALNEYGYTYNFAIVKNDNSKWVVYFGGHVYIDAPSQYLLKPENISANYAHAKVSVDNNTLNLINGVIYDQALDEVANSAFAVTKIDNPLYRRFNTELEGAEATDAPDTVKFYRVNATEKEFLYEDATSKYSKDLNFNFLGVEDKGTADKNAALYVDTAYVRNNTIMPQYLLAVRPNIVKGEVKLCDATNHSHATEEEALACPHTIVTPSYTDACYLINLKDSVELNEGLNASKYQWNAAYTRLGFVEARHIGDTLVIKNSIFTGNNKPQVVGKADTWAKKDSIFLGENKHNNVKFSFRLLKNGSNDFLIESEGNDVAPEKGGWIKIQNGVPVIAKYDSYKEAALDAEVFNVEKTTEAPTANESIEATEVSIVAVNGGVQVLNAAGKTVKVYTILGQQLASQIVTSDNATIAVPAGIVAVSVDGAEAVKVVVK